ncbi:MAG TPA: MATE family efflux transporter [Planctomycetaceae bacterium]|nr:MATE family efflux transporter [Planctomycetaceae bacterium]
MSAAPSESPHRLAHAPGSLAELLAIALPLMLSAATQSIMHVIDRMFLTWHSKEELAASLPAGILYWSCLSFPFGIASYINTFVAQYDGAGKPDRVAAAIWQGVYFSILAGLVLTLAAPWSETLFSLIGHEPVVAAHEATYFRWLCLGAMPAILHTALAAFYSGRGKTRVVLGVNVICVTINAFLDYVMIFGWGPFPEWGIAGAAMTDSFAELLAVGIFAVLLSRQSIQRQYPILKQWRYDRGLMGDLLKFGGASGLQMFIDVAGFAMFIMIIGWIGTKEQAATNIAFNLNTLAFIPVIGVGIAVSTLVGQRIGEGQPHLATRSTWKGFGLAATYMLVFGAIYTLLPDLLIAPYAAKADPAEFDGIRQTVIVLLRFVAVYSFFDAMAIVFGSAIRGAGDTRFSMIVAFLSAWILLVLPSYFWWRWWGPNVYASWTFCAVYVIALGFIYLARFQYGAWRTMSVIHRGETPTIVANTDAEPILSLVPESAGGS